MHTSWAVRRFCVVIIPLEVCVRVETSGDGQPTCFTCEHRPPPGGTQDDRSGELCVFCGGEQRRVYWAWQRAAWPVDRRTVGIPSFTSLFPFTQHLCKRVRIHKSCEQVLTDVRLSFWPAKVWYQRSSIRSIKLSLIFSFSHYITLPASMIYFIEWNWDHSHICSFIRGDTSTNLHGCTKLLKL